MKLTVVDAVLSTMHCCVIWWGTDNTSVWTQDPQQMTIEQSWGESENGIKVNSMISNQEHFECDVF